ncbi:hypothetical protein GCM10027589_36870 [Actinocorallia lasiicapitis]
MTSIRPLLALALPVVLATACAGQAPTKQAAAPAAPKASSSTSAAAESSGRTDALVEPPLETQGKSSDAGAPAADADAAVAGGAKAKGKKYPKPVYNNKMPKGFKRYNAPGAFNVNKLLYPRREYVGVFTDDALPGTPATRAAAWGKKIGKKPNMVKSFVNWGGGFDVAWAKGLWKYGVIPQFELELQTEDITLRDIANGDEDDYIRQLALSIRAANVPVAFSAFHEMNGDWYYWGHCSHANDNPENWNACKVNNTAADFRNAWNRMHRIFTAVGATNAIWMWQVNQVGARPNVRLKQFWPGAKTVDWVGVVGYYHNPAKKWIYTFDKVFRPTFVEVRKFTKKPIIIPEVGSWASGRRNADIKDFLSGVAHYPNVIGFLWFNMNKAGLNDNESDWRVEWNKSSLDTFRSFLKKGAYGVNTKKPQSASGK